MERKQTPLESLVSVAVYAVDMSRQRVVHHDDEE
jgi:hypothetical protein